MTDTARRSRTLATGVAAAVVGVLSLAGTPASAQPAQPTVPQPGPAAIAQSAATPNAALTPAAPNTALTVPATPNSALTPATPATAGAPAAVAPQPAAPATVPITPATSGTMADYFRDKGVTLEPQNSRDFKALNIVLPMPAGWAHVPDPNVPDAFAVIADRVGGNGLYSSNAQIVVYKLVGQFDPREAISHAFVDSQQLPAWRSTNGSMGETGGVPMASIDGTYRENAMTLDTSRRNIIATAGPDKYLVSLAVTTSVDQVVAAASATDAINRGFKVSVPTPGGAAAQATAPAAPAAPSQPPTPGQTAVPTPSELGTQAQQAATATPSALGAQTQPSVGLSG